jgi:hypothetical protein
VLRRGNHMPVASFLMSKYACLGGYHLGAPYPLQELHAVPEIKRRGAVLK